MDVFEKVVETLKEIGAPVAQHEITTKKQTYFTFFRYLKQNESFADGIPQSTGHYIQLDGWGKNDITDICDKAEALMENAGFLNQGRQSFYEKDTKIYHEAMRFFLNEGG